MNVHVVDFRSHLEPVPDEASARERRIDAMYPAGVPDREFLERMAARPAGSPWRELAREHLAVLEEYERARALRLKDRGPLPSRAG